MFVLTILAYRPIWSAGWAYEDSNAAFANPSVTGETPIAVDRARWLSALSHRLVYHVTPKPWLHHGVNLGLHLVNGGLVYAIGLVFLSPLAAWLAAAVFLLHPLQSEAVAYVASRSELLAATFALTAFWVSLKATSWTGHLVTWLCVALAVCAKESAVVIVPLIAIADAFRDRRLSLWRYLALGVPVALIAFTVLTLDHRSVSELSRLEYAATQATAIWRYLAMVVVPIGFSVDHDYELVPWAVRWLALAGVWVLMMVPLVLSVTMADSETKRECRLWDWFPRLKVCAFGVTWLLIGLAPRFVMRIPELLNEHQTYLAFIGVWLAIGSMAGVRETV